MNRLLPGGFANRSVRGVARCLALVRGVILTVMRHADDRKAARRAKREQRCSEMKLTDEMERKIVQRFMQNRGFRL
jgi:hypothetical protein